jgi:hypothetical protein
MFQFQIFNVGIETLLFCTNPPYPPPFFSDWS